MMNQEIMKHLKRLEDMIVAGDKKTKEEVIKYINEQNKSKKAKTTKKDGD